MRAMCFDAADLRANRAGRLSAAQVERVKSDRRRQSVIAGLMFGALVLFATAMIYAGQLNRNQTLALMGVLLIVVNAILVGVMARAFMRLGGDLRAGNVEVLAGDVERVLRRGRQGDVYLLRIGGASLPVTRDVFRTFRHEAPYRIYRSAHARLLLSAEALD